MHSENSTRWGGQRISRKGIEVGVALSYGHLLPYPNGSEWFYPHPLLTIRTSSTLSKILLRSISIPHCFAPSPEMRKSSNGGAQRSP